MVPIQGESFLLKKENYALRQRRFVFRRNEGKSDGVGKIYANITYISKS